MICGESMFNLRSKDAYEGRVCVQNRIKNKSGVFFFLFALFKLQKCVSVNFPISVMCGSFVLSGSALFLACFSLHFHLLWLL